MESAPCSHLSGGKARKLERVRCSSLVDWPVYPRLAQTMRASNDAQCGALAGASTSAGAAVQLINCLRWEDG